MTTKERYICEGCGQEFDDYNECERHETDCTNKHLKYRENINEAICWAQIKFGSLIAHIDFKVDEEIDCYDAYEGMDIYKFKINIRLSNGNEFALYDGFDENLSLGNYLDTNTIYKSLEREIENRLTLEYEGILQSNWEDGWRTDKLGAVDLSDIVDRLAGRKVKIAVVDDKSDTERAVSLGGYYYKHNH